MTLKIKKPAIAPKAMLLTSCFAAISATATTLSVEFNQDDQAGFDIWPTAFAGASSIAVFGSTTVEVTTSTGFGVPGNRGAIVDGTPPGFTYQHLYQDLLHATSPTGFISLNFSGLTPGQPYELTLYVWDALNTQNLDREWTVTGDGAPIVESVNWATTTLVDNDSFALKYTVTPTAGGTFTAVNTANLGGSAINGFSLTDPIPEPSSVLLSTLGLLGLSFRRRR